MQLHRVLGKADWSDVKPETRNLWQRLAVSSHGVATPANVVTLIGLAMVLYGLYAVHQQHYWVGLSMIVTGRMADLLDGFLADKTGTKSPLGEAMDVVADKAATILTISVFFVDKLAPWPLMLLALLPQVIIMVLPLFQWHQGNRQHPSRAGKLSMALLWVSLTGFVLIPALDSGTSWLAWIFNAGLLVSAALNFYSAARYIRLQD